MRTPTAPSYLASGSHSRESFPFCDFGSFSLATLFALCLLAISCLCEVFVKVLFILNCFCDFVSLSLYRLWLPIPSQIYFLTVLLGNMTFCFLNNKCKFLIFLSRSF